MKNFKANALTIIMSFVFAVILIFSSAGIQAAAYIIENFNAGDIFFVNMPDGDTASELEKLEKYEAGTGKEKKYIALTFDDGPHPVYTNKILDVLEEKNVKATFFVVGFRAELHPKTIIRMKELNCEVGNHTYEHKDLRKISGEDALYQIDMCNDIVFDIIGEYPKVYRPPFGKIGADAEEMIEMGGLKKILWTVDSWDWKSKDERGKVINSVMKRVKENSVILMHDFYKVTLSALPEIIDRLKAKEYEFKTVSELLDLGCINQN